MGVSSVDDYAERSEGRVLTRARTAEEARSVDVLELVIAEASWGSEGLLLGCAFVKRPFTKIRSWGRQTSFVR